MISSPFTGEPSELRNAWGLSSEIFATANGFCQEGMTVLSAREAVPFLGDLSRPWEDGKGKSWENHGKTIEKTMGKPWEMWDSLYKWRFLAGKSHRTMVGGFSSRPRLMTRGKSASFLDFLFLCCFICKPLFWVMNIVLETELLAPRNLRQSWASLYLFPDIDCSMSTRAKESCQNVGCFEAAGWRRLTRSPCPSPTPTRSINAPNAGRSCNCRLVEELNSVGSQWRGDKPTWRQHTTSCDITSYNICMAKTWIHHTPSFDKTLYSIT